MQITLVNPPSPFLIDERVFPSLGLLYVASQLESEGHNVRVIDLLGVQQEEWFKKLENVVEQTNLWGITFGTPQFPYAISISNMIRKIDGKAKIVAGGTHPTIDPKSCASYFDSTVVGEGERAMPSIIKTNPIPKIIRIPPIKDLDEIPFPARHLIDINSYHYTIEDKRMTNIITSRGCPYKCAFCCKVWGNSIRFRSSSNVLSEVKMLKNKYNIEGIMAYDDEMLIRWDRDKEIFKGLHKLGMVWRCFTRANLVNETRARKMSEYGCKEVLIGIESGSDEILKNIAKGTTREMNKRAIGFLKKYGIRVKATFIVGLPSESMETIAETESFIEEAQPDDVDFSILTVYPKSNIYEHPERYDLQFENINYAKNSAFFKTRPDNYRAFVSTSSLSSEDILRERNRLEAKFKRW